MASDEHESPPDSRKATSKGRSSAWKYVGGFAGLVALIGLAIAAAQLLQAVSASRSGNVAQATVVDILSQQLEVQRLIATAQSAQLNPGATATAASVRIQQLSLTQTVLEKAISVAGSASPQPVPQQAAGARIPVTVVPVDGVTGEIVDISRYGATLSIRLLSRNEGAKAQTVSSLFFASQLRDETTGKTYALAVIPASKVLPAEGEADVLVQYTIPAQDAPVKLTLFLSNGTIFQHVPIPTASP